MDFWFKTKSSSDVKNALKRCKELNLLGQDICIGTYLLQSYLVDSIIDEDVLCEDYDVVGVCVTQDNREHIVKTYSHLLGKNNYMVSLVERDDISNGNYDVPTRKVKTLNNFLKQIAKL